VGVCCQKVAEAEAFARAGVKDILVSNEVRDPAKIDRLARMPLLGARAIVCVDDIANVAELSEAAQKHGTTIECLVEIDCGAGRCGVSKTEQVVEIAKAYRRGPGAEVLRHPGLSGRDAAPRQVRGPQAKIDVAVAMVKDAVEALKAEGLECDIVGGGGTGSYYFEGNSGVYNELQCGSYAFMDADYGRILDKDGKRIDETEFENALFILTSVMSHAKADKAIVGRGPEVAVRGLGAAGGVRAHGREVRQVLGRARRRRGPAGRAQGQRQAAPRARPLRPDLQRARLVRGRAERQG
jgi:3-hydroxy-D-aspartate aldolase